MSTPKDFSHAAELPADDFAALAQPSSASSSDAKPNPNDPPWSLSAAVFAWAASLLLLVLIPLIAVVPYIVYQYRGADFANLAALVQTDKTLILISIVAILPVHLLTLAVVWMIVTGFGKRPFWQTLGWSWSGNYNFWTSAALAVALLLFAGLITTLIGGGKETDIDKIVASSTAARITTAFLATLTAPLVEEIIYRGVLYSALQRAIGMLWAIIGVSVLFAGVHVLQYSNNLGVITAVTLLSLTLTTLRAKSGRLLPCFVMHLVFNGIQSAYIVLQPLIQPAVDSGGQKAAAILSLTHTLRTLLSALQSLV